MDGRTPSKEARSIRFFRGAPIRGVFGRECRFFLLLGIFGHDDMMLERRRGRTKTRRTSGYCSLWFVGEEEEEENEDEEDKWLLLVVVCLTRLCRCARAMVLASRRRSGEGQLEGDAGDRAWCGGKTGSSHHHIAQYLGEQMQDGSLAGRAPSPFPY